MARETFQGLNALVLVFSDNVWNMSVGDGRAIVQMRSGDKIKAVILGIECRGAVGLSVLVPSQLTLVLLYQSRFHFPWPSLPPWSCGEAKAIAFVERYTRC